MIYKKAEIFEQLTGEPIPGASSENRLLQMTKDYPYFSMPHFFLLQQMHTNDINYQKQAAVTNLFFNNPHWLHYQLNQKDIIESKPVITANIIEEETIPQKSIENDIENVQATGKNINTPKPADDALIFEPLFASDYFASQGIKITEADVNPSDKLGKQLKSFTEWLKTMKKVHVEKLPMPNDSADINVQKLAEKSNIDEQILTEAMAEVFAKQNKNYKAIEVYEKLSLLNPSKSAYFAAKIQNLKGE